jgi:hypothetical protein
MCALLGAQIIESLNLIADWDLSVHGVNGAAQA